jgi:hypothetical protein
MYLSLLLQKLQNYSNTEDNGMSIPGPDTGGTAPTEQATVVIALPLDITIKTDTKAAIAERNPEIRKALVTMGADKEVARRIQVAVKMFTKLSELRKEANDLKRPDVVQYDATGTKTTEAFTKGQADKIKKNNEALTKWLTAFAEAVEQGKWEKADKLDSGGGDAKLPDADAS